MERLLGPEHPDTLAARDNLTMAKMGTKSRQWWQRAAQAGDPDAMNNLGLLLADSDPHEARDLTR
jgi:TPR repeat protein